MRYNTIRDILEVYMPFDFTNQMTIGAIMSDCGVLLKTKNVKEETLRNFLLEFSVSESQGLIEVKGGNLISTLWLINVFPPNPQNLISETIFSSGDLTYIYKSKDKSLKIVENGSNRRISKNTNSKNTNSGTSTKSGKNGRNK